MKDRKEIRNTIIVAFVAFSSVVFLGKFVWGLETGPSFANTSPVHVAHGAGRIDVVSSVDFEKVESSVQHAANTGSKLVSDVVEAIQTDDTESSELSKELTAPSLTPQPEITSEPETAISDSEEDLKVDTDSSISETGEDYTEAVCGHTYYGIELSDSDRYLLATVVTLESGGCSYECQKMTAACIMNRVVTKGISLADVIYSPNQFTTASEIPYTTPYQSCLDAVDDLMANGSDLPLDVTFFRASYYHDWSDMVVPYCNIDNVYFSRDLTLGL